ncbi:MAG TPA: hypothetical protein VMW08_00885 [Acidimicrobiales bacterium]|nr:hypothetical protein [Acidimicrobiales bacterium]
MASDPSSPMWPLDFGEGFRVPDVPEPIVGYRWWVRAGGQGHPLLLSPRTRLPWRPGEPTRAFCVPGSHNGGRDAACSRCPCPGDAANHDGYGCGLYAYRSLKALLHEIEFPTHKLGVFNSGWQVVVGQVELWGDVYEHVKGYRAQFARPSKLFVYPPPGDHQSIDPALIAELADGIDMAPSALELVTIAAEVRRVAPADLEALGEVYEIPVEPFPMSAAEVNREVAQFMASVFAEVRRSAASQVRASMPGRLSVVGHVVGLVAALLFLGSDLASASWFGVVLWTAMAGIYLHWLVKYGVRRRVIGALEMEEDEDG